MAGWTNWFRFVSPLALHSRHWVVGNGERDVVLRGLLWLSFDSEAGMD